VTVDVSPATVATLAPPSFGHGVFAECVDAAPN
jgi:hypothetical protein